MTDDVVTITELGCVGHFICAKDCNFRRHTQVTGPRGGYRVSTVGDLYYPDSGADRPARLIRRTVGSGEDDYFETFVFRTLYKQVDGNEGCGCVEVESWQEIDGRHSATAGEAQRVHALMVEKYSGIAERGR